jgi:hypothetical protein
MQNYGYIAPLLVTNRLKTYAEKLPANYLVELNKRLTAVVELLKTCLPVEKSRLYIKNLSALIFSPANDESANR